MSEYQHLSVMVAEVIAGLDPYSAGWYADGTVGGGGHAEAILRASSPEGRLVGCDLDLEALTAARRRLSGFEGRFELHQCNFVHLAGILGEREVDGVILDLGVSSPQLDRPERGFSFLGEGPLDMRMDPSQSLTAADVVHGESEAELAQLFQRYGEERYARRIARAIVRERERGGIHSTRELAELVVRVVPRREPRIHPATRVFQALRIRVNDELENLRAGLDALWHRLREGGRLVVITFHSLEAALVKQWSRVLARHYAVEGAVDRPEFRIPVEPQLRVLTRKPVTPGAEECRLNPRARSAQLRAFEKLRHGS